jgi:hypothetical protein
MLASNDDDGAVN